MAEIWGNDGWGVELWRGSVTAWQCDDMGHQNVRFYDAQAIEAIAVLFDRLGVRQSAAGAPGHVVLDTHIRFLREARAGTPLGIRGGIVALDATTVTVALVLFHALTGEASAAFQARCRRADPALGWDDDFVSRAEDMRVALPDICRARGISDQSAAAPSLALAEALGLAITGRGLLRSDECHREGTFRTEGVIGRISDASRTFLHMFHDAAAASTDVRSIGTAGLEVRLVYHAWPSDGDAFIVFAGIAAISGKTRRTLYWMFGAQSGRLLATLESIEALFDLDQRRVFALPDHALRALQPLVIDFDRLAG